MDKPTINPVERLGTIRDVAWKIKVNHGWGSQSLWNFANQIYDLCKEVVGPNPRDTNR